MQIKYKIILWFSSLVAGCLLLFSVYVYLSYASLRQRAMDGWLERKARVTEQLLTKENTVVGTLTTSLPEQVVFIYSPKDSLIFASEETNDFLADQAFRNRVREERVVRFHYNSPNHAYPKDGLALVYPGPWPSPSGKEFVAMVTAYDEDGYTRQRNLFDLLLFGNIISISLVGLLGFFFSRQALKPLNKLIDQLHSPKDGSLAFRLKPDNTTDEVGVLAMAFNELLNRQETLVDNQRAFISQASHELRTPLTTIKGWLETSLTYDSDVPTLKKGITQAARELDKLTALANGLLQLARLDQVNTQVEKQPLELVELILEAADSLGQQYPGQVLSVQVSESAMDQPLTVLGNTYLLKTALYNLLDNAVKYSDGQPVQLSLELADAANARLLIEDRGIGLTPGEEEKILQPLVRGSNVVNREGFGVGLTLTHRIVAIHRGKLSLQPRPGGGTIAEIYLPILP